MSVNRFIVQNLKANLRHYSLYIFALTFSVALYFAFVTLQYDPALTEARESIKGAAALKAASVLLLAIVGVFNYYANKIFVKRRSKEFGLLQLIGMTRGRIFSIYAAENFFLYFGSLALGTFIGFSFSKLVAMTLLRLVGLEAAAELHFSTNALGLTVLVFAVLYAVIMLESYVYIRRHRILSLFQAVSKTEAKVKPISVWEIGMGILGLTMIGAGYYISTLLFGGNFSTVTELFGAMAFILGSVIIGTYFFYKGSIRFILNLLRKGKAGYLNVREVVSLTPIMFRMKSSALLLTVITTLSALAIGLLSLTYISYYSAERTARNNVPHHFSVPNETDAAKFIALLDENNIPHRQVRIPVVQAKADFRQIFESSLNLEVVMIDPGYLSISIISERSVEDADVSGNEAVLAGRSDLLQKLLPMKSSGPFAIESGGEWISMDYVDNREDYPVSWYFSGGGQPTVIVDEAVFERLQAEMDPALQQKYTDYIGIDITDHSLIAKADLLFSQHGFAGKRENDSQLAMLNEQKSMLGLSMFVVGFLGLAFLVTSGCILYFKQVDEGGEEMPSYTILRKLGFTQNDLIRGIALKQLFNFGIPLAVGLLHSYFAVQSGWFLFGTELWTPMFIVMGLYIALYSIFGILSVLHYRRVVRESL